MTMALLHRTLITWLLTLIFCSLIAYKIDYSVEWNWFFVFIPSFLHSFILILYVVFKMIQLMKSSHERQVCVCVRACMCVCVIILFESTVFGISVWGPRYGVSLGALPRPKIFFLHFFTFFSSERVKGLNCT